MPDFDDQMRTAWLSNWPKPQPKTAQTFKCSGGDCVKVTKHEDGTVTVTATETKPNGAVSITANEWSDFLKRVKAGEFDG